MSDFDNNPWAASNVTDEYGSYSEPRVHVPDYLVPSILVTLFCCLPLGIVGIISSSKARSLKDAGQYQAALAQSKTAKICVIVSVVCGLIAIAIQVAIVISENGGF